MKKIFIPTPLDNEISIPKDTTHHIVNVFRHNFAQPITVSGSDGRTADYIIKDVIDGEAQATCVNSESLKINESTNEVGRPPDAVSIVLIQAFLKGDKFEWVLQKATELDAASIYAVPLAHCVANYNEKKLQQKAERWQKIVLEAAQQCGRNQLPPLEASLSLDAVLAAEEAKGTLLLVAYENEEKHNLRHVLDGLTEKPKRVAIIIGPEGGISAKEVERLLSKGVQPVSLGPTILRAETAAIGAISMLQYALNL